MKMYQGLLCKQRKKAQAQTCTDSLPFLVPIESCLVHFGISNSEGWFRSKAPVVGTETALYATGPRTGSSQHVLVAVEFFEFSSEYSEFILDKTRKRRWMKKLKSSRQEASLYKARDVTRKRTT